MRSNKLCGQIGLKIMNMNYDSQNVKKSHKWFYPKKSKVNNQDKKKKNKYSF